MRGMVRASRLFSEEEKKAVESAIEEAEKKTSGEIVAVVATRSGRYDRAEDTIGVVIGIIAVAVVWLCFQKVEMVQAEWTEAPRLAVSLLVVLLTFVAGFVGGTMLATCVPLLSYPLIPRREREEEVERAAREAFFRFRVRGTRGGTGILVYVSLFERMVRVIGDDAISEKLEESHWNGIRDLIVDGIRRGKPAEGLSAAIKRCGELLAEHFPVEPGDVDELKNELHLID